MQLDILLDLLTLNTCFLEKNIGNPLTHHKSQIRMPPKLLTTNRKQSQTGTGAGLVLTTFFAHGP